MKLNKSTTLSKLKEQIQTLRVEEFKHIKNNDYDKANDVVKELHKLKADLLEMLMLDII